MTIKFDEALALEWQTLHNSHEQYEHYALLIKLFAVAITAMAIIFSFLVLLALSLLAILWLQEGIWKTFQARTSARIEDIEQAITTTETNISNANTSGKSKTAAFQFYRQWESNRPTTLGLIASYIKNALKPTVIYPYLPLMLVIQFISLYSI